MCLNVLLLFLLFSLISISYKIIIIFIFLPNLYFLRDLNLGLQFFHHGLFLEDPMVDALIVPPRFPFRDEGQYTASPAGSATRGDSPQMSALCGD